ncbi:hypothetical protein PCC21_016770 [Pectobacterium carotovorum subsp. carotovorum PCC21]|nr:hypothetical protein PCC21_016770 [Pectobacterium carotovorum subsp. carotovorum PCC21]
MLTDLTMTDLTMTKRIFFIIVNKKV